MGEQKTTWEHIVESWLGPKRVGSPVHADLLFMFEHALANTTAPDESGFGYPSKKSSLGVFFGNIMLAGVFGSTVEILVDTDVSGPYGCRTRVVGTSVHRGPLLYWITADIREIGAISRMPSVWEHYRLATTMAGANPSIRGNGRNYARDKYKVSQLMASPSYRDSSFLIEELTTKEVERSLADGQSARMNRLTKASPKPLATYNWTKTFSRNPDVIAEVLFRANGICQRCGKAAPFTKDRDGSPYLEVHHRRPLKENGDDTLDNAIALCPNCHRHAHHGASTFD